VREALTRRYQTWRPYAKRGYAHLPDLSVAFVERALELAAPDGVAALLVPAKLATAGYATPLRQRLTERATIARAAPVDERSAAAFGAAVYPLVLVAARTRPDPSHCTTTALGPAGAAVSIPQRSLSGAPWVLVPDADRVARRLAAELPAISERWTIQLGVKTGADALFLTTAPGRYTVPAVRGRDVTPFAAHPRVFLYWTHDGAGRPLERLPATLAAHFEPHRDRLERRADYRGGPPWQLFRTALARAPHRVIWPDLARRLAAAVPGAGVVPLNTVYGVATRGPGEAFALAALLNARWLTALARLAADPARGGFFRCNATVVGRLPLPRASAPGWERLSALGARGETDDHLVAELLELDATDLRALDPLAPAPR
jgi:hypothetical protein